MTRIKTPNQRKLYDSLSNRLLKYEEQADTTINSYNERVAVLVAASALSNKDKPFTFASSSNKAQLNNIIQEAKVALYGQILSNTSKEWKKSNEAQDNMLDQSVSRIVGEEDADEYKQDNDDELKRFQERSDEGTTVYNRVDNHTKKYKSCLEAAISLALMSGATLGAAYLFSRIKHYLSNFNELYENYTKKFGEKKNLSNAMFYIKRLVSSEANMAYRRAELLRWQQMPFVIGYRVCLDKSHKDVDICDDLKGIYPKTFIWTGWHPNDRCFCVPVLQSSESLRRGEAAEQITEFPKNFKYHYLDAMASNKAKYPYYITENPNLAQKLGYGNRKLGRGATRKADAIISEIGAPTLTAEQEKNVIEIAEAMGLKKSRPMSFKDAGKYSNTGYGYAYRDNCQSCVAVFEARRRGLNITALSYDEKNTIQKLLSEKFEIAWVNKNGKTISPTKISNKDYNKVLSLLDKRTEQKGRYCIGINYEYSKEELQRIKRGEKVRKRGHVISAERLSDNQIIYFDPQYNEVVSLVNEVEVEYIEVLRIDNLLFDSNIIANVARKLLK